MQRLVGLILLILFFSGANLVTAQDEVEQQPEIAILSPLPGQAIRGSVPIVVDTATQGFVSSELTFGYHDDTTGTRFLITQSFEPIQEEILTEWDTTTLTDGVYDLLLEVFLEDGDPYISVVPALRVRNYSPIETDTPTPTTTSAPQATPSPSVTPSPTPTKIPPTPTPLPPNPLQVTHEDIWVNLLRGAAGGFAAILLAGLYLSVRRFFRK